MLVKHVKHFFLSTEAWNSGCEVEPHLGNLDGAAPQGPERCGRNGAWVVEFIGPERWFLFGDMYHNVSWWLIEWYMNGNIMRYKICINYMPTGS